MLLVVAYFSTAAEAREKASLTIAPIGSLFLAELSVSVLEKRSVCFLGLLLACLRVCESVC